MNTLPPFDPSQMDPKMLMELSQLIQQLSPAQMSRMQTLMHTMMAGQDVRQEMEEFERTLPPVFRQKITQLMGNQMGMPFQEPPAGASSLASEDDPTQNMDMREARLTLLRAVAEGHMTPEDAERLLFPTG